MTTVFENAARKTITGEFVDEDVSMRYSEHLVRCPMYHKDAVSADSIAQQLELLRALVMPAGCDDLAEEALASEAFGIHPLLELLCAPSITIGWKGAFGIRLVNEFRAKETISHFHQLDVDVLRNQQVDTIPQVFKISLFRFEFSMNRSSAQARLLTTVFLIRAAVDSKTNEAILPGMSKP